MHVNILISLRIYNYSSLSFPVKKRKAPQVIYVFSLNDSCTSVATSHPPLIAVAIDWGPKYASPVISSFLLYSDVDRKSNFYLSSRTLKSTFVQLLQRQGHME